MAKPKLSTKTPDDPQYNTLIETHDSILAMPRERRYAIVELSTKDVRTDIADGDQQATMVIIHLEQPATSADAKKLEALLDEFYTRRTKNKVRALPGAEDTPLEGLAETESLGGDDSVS